MKQVFFTIAFIEIICFSLMSCNSIKDFSLKGSIDIEKNDPIEKIKVEEKL